MRVLHRQASPLAWQLYSNGLVGFTVQAANKSEYSKSNCIEITAPADPVLVWNTITSRRGVGHHQHDLHQGGKKCFGIGYTIMYTEGSRAAKVAKQRMVGICQPGPNWKQMNRGCKAVEQALKQVCSTFREYRKHCIGVFVGSDSCKLGEAPC